jgi:DNA-directed RNA polymerase subunit RPC12/RpoP
MTDEQDDGQGTKASVSDDERDQMIAARAWFRAEKRHFSGGDPLADWLDAESEVDRSVLRNSPEMRWAEYEADRQLRWSVADRFAGSEPASTNQILIAIDETAEEMVSTGDHDEKVVDRVATTFRKDVANWAEHSAEQDDRSGMLFGLWPQRGRVILEQARSTLEDWREHILRYLDDHRTYHSGEVVAPGGFSCVQCGTRLEMEQSGHLKPCPHCYHTRFRRLHKL